jgi:polyhydroxyalkanoate synthesis regulator phasin
MNVFKIAIVLGFLIWFSLSVKFVESDAGQIVSEEKVSIDTVANEIKMVTPDEIQRLENDRDREMTLLKGEMAELRDRVTKLENQINQ